MAPQSRGKQHGQPRVMVVSVYEGPMVRDVPMRYRRRLGEYCVRGTEGVPWMSIESQAGVKFNGTRVVNTFKNDDNHDLESLFVIAGVDPLTDTPLAMAFGNFQVLETGRTAYLGLLCSKPGSRAGAVILDILEDYAARMGARTVTLHTEYEAYYMRLGYHFHNGRRGHMVKVLAARRNVNAGVTWPTSRSTDPRFRNPGVRFLAVAHLTSARQNSSRSGQWRRTYRRPNRARKTRPRRKP